MNCLKNTDPFIEIQPHICKIQINSQFHYRDKKKNKQTKKGIAEIIRNGLFIYIFSSILDLVTDVKQIFNTTLKFQNFQLFNNYSC